MLLLFMAGCLCGYAQATLTISDFKVMPGETKTITIDMTNSLPIRAFQVQVCFPDGVTLAARPTLVEDRIGSYEDEFGEEVACSKTLSYNKWEDGSYMIVVNADDGYPFSGTEGGVITLKVKAAADATLGTYTMTLQNMELVYEDGVSYINPENTTCNVTIYHTHTPNEYGVCTECSEAVNLVIDDAGHADFAAEYDTYATVTYSRTMAQGDYGTVVLPFVPDAESRANYLFYAFSHVGDDYLLFDEVEEPEANTPYLYCLREGKEAVAITGGVTTVSTELTETEVGYWTFVGSLTNAVVNCDSLITSDNVYHYAYNVADNVWNRITKALTVLPYRAFIKQNANVSTLRMRVYVRDETNGIREISRDHIEGLFLEGTYDLQGRPVENQIKGKIYIINGKKVIY